MLEMDAEGNPVSNDDGKYDYTTVFKSKVIIAFK